MRNPWLSLQEATLPYVLGVDVDHINRHAPFSNGDTKIIASSLPQPYIGNPETARVVFLALNPGHDPKRDSTDHRDNQAFRQATLKNLRHEPQEYPFYPLNPEFSTTGAGEWWLRRTRSLRDSLDIDAQTLSERLMVIEWFPYHSKSFSEPPELLPSQYYSFHLAKKALESTHKLVVRMRSRRQWTDVDKRFENVAALRNPRSAYISERNAGTDLYAQMVRILR